jgi:hypothetical protein
VSDPVTYTAALPIGASTVHHLSVLLHRERIRLGTRRRRRRLGCWRQAVLVLRWLCDATRIAQLAADNRVSLATAYRYLHEGIDVLAAQAPDLHNALLAARAAGYTHLGLDGTVIRTDRITRPGPNPGVHLWWSGKHHHHGGNIQMITTPDGWPLWVSPVRPGRDKDVTCLRRHPRLLEAIIDWTDPSHVVMADLGYEGESTRLVCPIKRHRGRELNPDERTVNQLHSATRALAERGNALLKTTFKALHRVTLCPWRIGAITAAALVVLHHDRQRTT